MSKSKKTKKKAAPVQPTTTPCPGCGDTDPNHREMRNYSIIWHEADIHCTECGEFVRYWDAG